MSAGPARALLAAHWRSGAGAQALVLSSVAPPAGSDSMTSKSLYKVIFANQGKVYEVYARHVSHGSLFGFVEVEKLVFGARSSVVVDPTEEKIQTEFADVSRTYLPLHSIIRIDEVEKQGVSKITDAQGGNVAQFPMPMYPPGGTAGKDGPKDN